MKFICVIQIFKEVFNMPKKYSDDEKKTAAEMAGDIVRSKVCGRNRRE